MFKDDSLSIFKKSVPSAEIEPGTLGGKMDILFLNYADGKLHRNDHYFDVFILLSFVYQFNIKSKKVFTKGFNSILF